MVDYIIVGLGLAGIAFCEELEANNKSFVVYEDNSQHSSTVAGGLYNPVILKRFTLAWNADQQLQTALPMYKALEAKLNTTFDQQLPVKRRFNSVEEQNLWFEASDKPALENYLDTTIEKNQNPSVKAPFGLGRVQHTGRIHTGKLVHEYRNYLKSKKALRTETFDHHVISFQEERVSYKDIIAKRIVFAEGFGIQSNPFFNYLPLRGTKGELLTIKAPELHVDSVIKSSVFVIPIKDDIYRIGATYNWEDKTNEITQAAREELIGKLEDLITCDYEIIDQIAGMRPTVADRRPLIGIHPKHTQLAILNGLGTRGVMVGPTIAKQLYSHIEHAIPLPAVCDIKRFEKRYRKSVKQEKLFRKS